MAVVADLMDARKIISKCKELGVEVTMDQAEKLRLAMFDENAPMDDWIEETLAKILPPMEPARILSEFPA